MDIRLPPRLQAFISREVDAGRFHSAEEAICEGLTLLQQTREWAQSASDKIDIGWQQAEAGDLLDPEAVRASLKARKADWKPNRS